MQPRILGTAHWPLGKVYFAQSTDTAFWLTTAFTISLIVAVVLTLSSNNIQAKPAKLKFAMWFNFMAVGCALAGVNWLIGSQWAIAASSLFPSS
jgi:hypothetical protein